MGSPEKIIDRIRKLLALSKSPNEAEAALAATKAHELLREYNLVEADIGDQPEPSRVEETNHCVMRSLSQWRVNLAKHVALSNFCRIVRVRDPKRRIEALKFVGRGHNISASIVLYDYLSQAVQRLSRQLKDRRVKRDKYRDGVVDGLGFRLFLNEQQQTGSTALVVLRTEVDQHVSSMGVTSKAVEISPNTASYRRGLKDSHTIGLDKQLDGGTTRAALGGAS